MWIRWIRIRIRSATQKKQTIKIPFQILPRKSKQLGIPFRATKIEANCRNAFPNHPTKEKTTQNKTTYLPNLLRNKGREG